MHIFWPSRPSGSETQGAGPSNLYFNKHSTWVLMYVQVWGPPHLGVGLKIYTKKKKTQMHTYLWWSAQFEKLHSRHVPYLYYCWLSTTLIDLLCLLELAWIFFERSVPTRSLTKIWNRLESGEGGQVSSLMFTCSKEKRLSLCWRHWIT